MATTEQRLYTDQVDDAERRRAHRRRGSAIANMLLGALLLTGAYVAVKDDKGDVFGDSSRKYSPAEMKAHINQRREERLKQVSTAEEYNGEFIRTYTVVVNPYERGNGFLGWWYSGVVGQSAEDEYKTLGSNCFVGRAYDPAKGARLVFGQHRLAVEPTEGLEFLPDLHFIHEDGRPLQAADTTTEEVLRAFDC